MAVAMVVSPRVAVRPANLVESRRVASVAWNVASALLNTPKADTSAVSAVLLRFRALHFPGALNVSAENSTSAGRGLDEAAAG